MKMIREETPYRNLNVWIFLLVTRDIRVKPLVIFLLEKYLLFVVSTIINVVKATFVESSFWHLENSKK